MASITRPPQSAPLSRWRINLILCFCLIFAVANGYRLFDVQVLQHASLSDQASAQFEAHNTLQPKRGKIYASDGGVLAMNVDYDTVAATPRLIDPERIDSLALSLAPLVGKQPSAIQALLQQTASEYVVLGRRIPPDISDQISKLEEPGLLLQPEPVRVYPQGAFAATVVGVANHENVGISGIEGYLNDLLSGKPGSLRAEVDPASNPIWINPPQVQTPHDGADVTLTIDAGIQHIVEEELKQGVLDHNASGGTVIVIQPQTGAILGMASWPDYDPNHYIDYPEDVYNRNPAITDQYEPGSTFKVINLAIGLQSGAFSVDTVVNDPGSIERAPGCCSNWDGTGHAPMNPANVLGYSSNVGALQFAEMTGAERFYAGIKAFGYGEPTGIELSGEASGMVQWPDSTEDWRPIVLSTNGYGQGIAVTPLQQIRAVAAIANGGKLMQPYIIKQWCDSEGCHATNPQLLRQVVDERVTKAITPMLVRVANNNYAFQEDMWFTQCYPQHYDSALGAGVSLVPGYDVAAKTGTSSIPDGRGGYENATIGSVVGFGPANDAQFAVLVKLDRPDDIWGVSAIPIYAHVMQRLLTHAHIAPDPALVADCQQ